MDTQNGTSNTYKKKSLKVALSRFALGVALAGWLLAYLAYNDLLGNFYRGL